ncbi:MAG: acyl-CoA thioesterase [Acidobacteria bacterium]|jgi:acyl-CoA thioester hydrolase|nr:acyl-CoA thioesterase [Acidobacteriota bacterium]
MDNGNHFDKVDKWCETLTRVRYAETDQAGVVYHANYLVWFEIGRVELCRSHGFNYRDMEAEEDALLPVTEARATYRQPAKYDDQIAIRTRVTRLRSRAISFAYEIRRATDGQLLAEGETHHIVIDSRGRARPFPSRYSSLLRAAVESPPAGAVNQQ